MTTHTSEASAIAVSSQARVDDIQRHISFRFCVFALSAASGYLFSHLAYEGIRLLPSLGASAHAAASPFLDILRMLRSGFSN
jgi:hypothetical protein